MIFLLERAQSLHLNRSLGYSQLVSLVMGAKRLIRDSGEIQAETTRLGTARERKA